VTLRVAITRTAAEARATAARIQMMGAAPVVAPLLSIKSSTDCDWNVSGAQALLFTSGNGVQEFALRNPQTRKLTVITVGDATADLARACGFAAVISADGDVNALIEKARWALSPSAGKVIHFAGTHVAGDLAGALTAAGFDAERRIAYEAVAADALPPAFSEPLDIVLFHSARAAETFVTLGAPNADKLTAACISEAVAQAAGKARWARIIVSPAPREDALLRAALAPNSPAGASA
jgi:uroporphyrinogen-III synthase